MIKTGIPRSPRVQYFVRWTPNRRCISSLCLIIYELQDTTPFLVVGTVFVQTSDVDYCKIAQVMHGDRIPQWLAGQGRRQNWTKRFLKRHSSGRFCCDFQLVRELARVAPSNIMHSSEYSFIPALWRPANFCPNGDLTPRDRVHILLT